MPYVPRGNKPAPALEGPFMVPAPDPFQPMGVLTTRNAPNDDASFGDLVSANFRSESILGNLAEIGAYQAARLAQDRVKDYDPMTDPSVMDLPPHLKALYEDSMSPGETEIIHERVRLEREWAETLSAEGMTGRGFVASMVSQAPDMLMLHALGVATNLAKAPTLAGRVGRGAGIALATETAQEAFKQGFQETRTAEQSAGNILGATVLGAAIPFAGTMIRNIDLDAMGAKLDDVARRAYNGADDAVDGIKDELANPLNRVRPDEAAGTIASRVPLLKNWSPNFRVDKWTSPAMQKAQRALLSTARILNKNIAGEASESVEAATKFHYGILDNALLTENKAFEKYAGNYGKRVANLISRTKMTRKEFSNAVSQAIRTGEHEIPEVLEAAKPYQDLFAHFAKEMRESGLSDIADNERYLQRLYDYVKIRNDPAGWDTYITDALVRLKGMDPVEAGNVARGVRETLTEQKGVMTGPLKSRVFDLPDDVLSPYMVNDIREIAAHYTRYLAPRIELAKAAKAAGLTPKLTGILAKLSDLEKKLGHGDLTAENARHLIYGKELELRQIVEEYTKAASTVHDAEGRLVEDGMLSEIREYFDLKKRTLADNAELAKELAIDEREFSEDLLTGEQLQRLEDKKLGAAADAEQLRKTLSDITETRKIVDESIRSLGTETRLINQMFDDGMAKINSAFSSGMVDASDLAPKAFDVLDREVNELIIHAMHKKSMSEVAYKALAVAKGELPKVSEMTAKVSEIAKRIRAVESSRKMVGPDGALVDNDLIAKYYGNKQYTDAMLSQISTTLKQDLKNAMTDFKDATDKAHAVIYHRTLARRIERLRYAEAAENRRIARDAININWMKDEVRADYEALYKAAYEAGNTDLANRINAEKLDALEDLEASRQLVTGAYGADNDPTGVVSRLTRGALAWNSARLLGRVVLSQIPDVVVPVMKFGGVRTAKAAKALATGIRNDPELAGDLQLMRAFAGAIDTINNNRILEVTDMGGRSFERTAVEAGLERLSGIQGTLTGFNAFNDITKQVTALSFSDYALRAARTVADGGKLRKFDKAFLASLGLGDKELRMLGKLSAHEKNGLVMPDFSRWGGVDSAPSRAYANALRQAVDTTIVTPTLGQKALWTRTNWGKLMFQFKGYMQASTESIAGFLEQKWTLGDRNDRLGVVLATGSMVAAGGASYALKRAAYGKGLPKDDAELAIEAVDNSGVAGLFMELNNTVEKVSGGNIGLRPAMGVQSGAFRYSSRSPLGSMLGPTFTGTEDLLNVTGKWEKMFGPEPMPGSMKKNMIKMMPLNNALFLNMAYDGIDFIGESTTGGEFLPGTPLRRFGDEPNLAP